MKINITEILAFNEDPCEYNGVDERVELQLIHIVKASKLHQIAKKNLIKNMYSNNSSMEDDSNKMYDLEIELNKLLENVEI